MVLLLLVLMAVAVTCDSGVTSRYQRGLQMLPDMTLDANAFRALLRFNVPEQVRIAQVDLTTCALPAGTS